MTSRHIITTAAATIAAAVAIATGMTGCRSVDDNRIPPMAVRISFNTYGDWQLYGIAAATQTRRFILSERQPAGFPYTAASATGYGGVLLVGQYTYAADPQREPPLAYDLACPVEVKPTVRVVVDTEHLVARCPVCGSTYDIFQGYGMPLSGPAATEQYGLTRYRVSTGGPSSYVVVTN